MDQGAEKSLSAIFFSELLLYLSIFITVTSGVRTNSGCTPLSLHFERHSHISNAANSIPTI